MSAIQQALLIKSNASGVTYATWDPANKAAPVALSGGNLIANCGVTANASVRATLGKSSGKWYWEATWTTVSSGPTIGICSSLYTFSNWPGGPGSTSYGYDPTGTGIYFNGSVILSGAGFAAGDILGFALDCGANTIAFYKNNTLINTATSIGVATWYPAVGQSGTTTNSVTANFGASALTYGGSFSGFNQGIY